MMYKAQVSDERSLPPELSNRSTCSGAPEGATGAFCVKGIVWGTVT